MYELQHYPIESEIISTVTMLLINNIVSYILRIKYKPLIKAIFVILKPIMNIMIKENLTNTINFNDIRSKIKTL